MAPRFVLHLYPTADAAWTEVIRPWLEGAAARLQRSHVIVPTRGQAQALKQRCLRENVALLGVEFITPGLARQKWIALAGASRPAMGRELLLLNLRALIEERLAPLTQEDAAWGLWKSLQSDPERALDDFDELLQVGLEARDFPLAALRDVFGELVRRVTQAGYDFAARQAIAAATGPLASGAQLAGRVLAHGFAAEHAREFFSVLALVRRAADVTVLVPEPEFGRKDDDERWVEAWEKALGTAAVPLDAPAAAGACAAIARQWTGGDGSPGGATVLVGRTRVDEMQLAAEEIVRRLAAGADNVAVVFPAADAAALRLARLLTARGVPFNDLLDNAGPVGVEFQLQRALLTFYERGARLEELLALWPLLHAIGQTTLPPGPARDVCERVFDARQSHALAVVLPDLAARNDPRWPEWREVARVAGLLLPPWPDQLTLEDALARFARVSAQFRLAGTEAWQALAAYAAQDRRVLPAKVVLAALASFLPEKAPASGAAGRGGFAPVTLTTWRRAAALAWSDVIFTQSNAGVWPVRVESSCWLTDEQREELNRRVPHGIRLFTGETRAWLEKQGVAAIAANTTGAVAFSAALFNEEEPELKLAPNAWLERVLLAAGEAEGLEEQFARLARTVMIAAPSSTAATRDWFEIWQRRRDPAAPFDDYFLSGDPVATRPAELTPRLIERAVQDPAELWFEGVLRLRRTGWTPLVRARKKSLGSLVHRVLAAALRGAPVEGVFRELPASDAAQAALRSELERLRAQWPRDRYWDSFHAELGELARLLLEQVYQLPAVPFAAVETKLPEGTMLELGADGGPMAIVGRMDLALSSRPAWQDAAVEVVDFKTGADARLSAQAMARGASLQLGVYLAAVCTLGAADARVWMLKPDGARPSSLGRDELPEALTALAQLGRHLATGRYGARTPDRTDFSHGYAWPLACAPIRHAILERKFTATFGVEAGAEMEAADE